MTVKIKNFYYQTAVLLKQTRVFEHFTKSLAKNASYYEVLIWKEKQSHIVFYSNCKFYLFKRSIFCKSYYKDV